MTLIIVMLSSGEVHYARNGHYVATLMHVDTSLPLWAFLDIYGTMKEIKSIGESSLCMAVVFAMAVNVIKVQMMAIPKGSLWLAAEPVC